MDKETILPQETSEAKDESTWAHDQQRRDYYYDDSHGYELYNPDQEDESEDDAD